MDIANRAVKQAGHRQNDSMAKLPTEEIVERG